MKKITHKQYGKTAYDRKMDKSGKHAKEGSKKDMAQDRAAMRKMNKGSKKK